VLIVCGMCFIMKITYVVFCVTVIEIGLCICGIDVCIYMSASNVMSAASWGGGGAV
jgi:hypothetical protein